MKIVSKSILEHFDKTRKRLGRENIIGLAIFIILSFASFNILFTTILVWIHPWFAMVISLFLYASVVYVMLLALPYILQSLNRVDLILFVVVALVFIISFIISKQRSLFFVVGRSMAVRGVPLYLLFRSIKDYRKQISMIKNVAYPIIAAQVLVFFFLRENWDTNYSLSAGYEALLALVALLTGICLKVFWYDIILLFTTFVFIVLLGARGPLLIALVIIYIFAIFAIINKTPKLLIKILVVVITIALVFGIINIEMLSPLIKKMKLQSHSRIFASILSGRFFQSLGRSEIYKVSIEHIKNNLFIGTGVINERLIIAASQSVDGVIPSAQGYYPHNLFLEFMMQFGTLPGLLVALLIAFFAVRGFIKQKDTMFRVSYIAVFSIGFLPLMLSFSYLQWPLFYAFVAMVINGNVGIQNQEELAAPNDDMKRLMFDAEYTVADKMPSMVCSLA